MEVITTGSIGMRVKALREAKGWTQGQLAKAAGLHPVTIAKYETDVIGMSLDSAVKLAAALNCTVDKVAGIEDDKGQGQDVRRMTRHECEDKLIELAEQMRELWKEYNPSCDFMSVTITNELISLNDCYFAKDGGIVIDARDRVFRTVCVAKHADGYINRDK